MVRCVDCLFCTKMKSDVDKRKFFICSLEYQRLLDMDTPDKWALYHSGVLEKAIEIDILKEHDCSKFKAKSP